MEVAIRAVNWVWILGTLERWPVAQEDRRSLLSSLQVHGRHIATHLEGSPYLRSNHYLGDMLGLLAVGSALRADRLGSRWLERARHAFERQIRSQVLEDGVDFEASVAYHGLVTEMFILARWLCNAAGKPLSPGYDTRLVRMLMFSHAIRLPNGEIPLFGDNDSGRILPADSTREPTHDHLLSLGAAALGLSPLLPDPPHAEVAWTFGVESWNQLRRSEYRPVRRAMAFPYGGYYVLADETFHLVARCGDVGQNGNGGHAHNDLLSFVLSCADPIIVDSGLGDYTGDPGLRNYARATRAHNTVVVEDEEINPIVPDDLFRLRQRAEPALELWQPGRLSSILRVAHDGYERLPQTVVHHRTFVLDHIDRLVKIDDELSGSGHCNAETLLHLAPDVIATRDGPSAVLVATPSGQQLRLAWRGPRAELLIAERRVSRRYGTYQRGSVVFVRLSGTLPLRFGWTFSIVRRQP